MSPRRREVPFDPVNAPPAGMPVRVAVARDELQAVMEAKPHEEPDWSAERLLPLRDVIGDALDEELTDRELWIFNALIIERRSIRSVAASLSLSKTYVHKLRNQAQEKLRIALADHPLILKYLARHEVNGRIERWSEANDEQAA